MTHIRIYSDMSFIIYWRNKILINNNCLIKDPSQRFFNNIHQCILYPPTYKEVYNNLIIYYDHYSYIIYNDL